MSEAEEKPVAERCECHLVPDQIKGWKISVCGCERELKEIQKNLGPHAREYLRNHVEKVEP